MKNANPAGKRLRFATAGERLFGFMLFAVVAALIYLAMSGKYDREVNRFAGWMRTQWHALVD